MGPVLLVELIVTAILVHVIAPTSVELRLVVLKTRVV